MDLKQYESRTSRPIQAKVPDFQRHERLKHVLFSQQFNTGLLNHLARVATNIRALAKSRDGHIWLSQLLPHKRAMLYFTQASTRTFLSFTAACQILGITCNEIRDPKVSSEYKGENPLDSVRMFSSYFDLIIMRSVIANFAECCAYLMNDLERSDQRSVPIISGGAGTDQHPTQALLDMYTILRTFEFTSPQDSSLRTRFAELQSRYPSLTKGPADKTYCFCGDIGRGRTVRSLSVLLSLYENVTMIFVAPDHDKLRLSGDLKQFLISRKVKVIETEDLREVIGEADCLYMTRIQHEHDKPEDKTFFDELDMSRYTLTPEMVGRMRDYTPIMHPFPRNEEIPFEIDKDPRAMYFRQARNGMWIRAALIAYLFDMDGRIMSKHAEMFSDYQSYNEGVLA
ncbi:MAG: aspartate carbamoyltransferase [Deltaproteobacteria bacterium]|nr:aspartate carbamoyltransferase [bacterium]MCB9477661.1 aspartate carbamoyltransferase [Deltaproteobacteria bacterium]MCB9489495.1 aspartate carbamoyltransferase [Deltaproteobacteria bacterium]